MTDINAPLSPPTIHRPTLGRAQSYRHPQSTKPTLERVNSFSPIRKPHSARSHSYSPQKRASPKSVVLSDESVYSSCCSSDDDDDEEVSAHDLLAAAKGRMEQQKLMDELHQARRIIEEQKDEIHKLQGQLHMAIRTKHDLVIANSELEQQHELDLNQLTRKECAMKRTSLAQQELRAEVEKDFMNELTRLAMKVETAEQRGIRELQKKDELIVCLKEKLVKMNELMELADRVEDDEERLIQACTEKDEIIQRLQDKVNRMERQKARRETNKVQYYKVKLGM